MIARVIFAIAVSFFSGFCYLSGVLKLMSALLIGFGVMASLFFGIIFTLPASADRLWFPIYGNGSSWPFFLIAVLLLFFIVWLFLRKAKPVEQQAFSRIHMKFLGVGLLGYLCSLFLPAILWFPSEQRRLATDMTSLKLEVLSGVCLYLLGSALSLYLLYRGTLGGTEENPDLMRRFILAFFAFFQLDKMPALVAYFLIYSPETGVIFPEMAALALAAYLPVAFFLMKVSGDSQQE